MSPHENAPVATVATNEGGSRRARTSPQETYAPAGYPEPPRGALDLCPWCAFPRPVVVTVTFTAAESPMSADACRDCAPSLIAYAGAESPPDHAIAVASRCAV